jgi:hypothetical protein
MATLVLSTVGTALGGPVGGAIGSLIGQSIDQQLFSSPRKGPRLGDLAVQTSSYGTQIPRIYGTMRIAGSIVWATDLVESSATSGAKGQPDVTYSYSVSFAVALSSRPLREIRRIWADGNLLRGEAGDFKASTEFRFYKGSEDQVVDPLIGSIEGAATTPAFRGLALAVFENLELADYGNRIPFLTFEVVGDDADPTFEGLLGDASGGCIAVADTRSVGGYAATGKSIRAAIEPLVTTFDIELVDRGGLLQSPDATVVAVSESELGASADESGAARVQRDQEPARELPASVLVTYYDPQRDYQSGLGRADGGARDGDETQVEMPAVMSAASARSLAEEVMARAWARRDRVRLKLPPPRLGLLPGTRLRLPWAPDMWRVETSAVEAMAIAVDLRPDWQAVPQIAADPGRSNSASDLVFGPPSFLLAELPSIDGSLATAPTVYLAASNATVGWKPVAVEIVGPSWLYSTATAAAKSVLGTATSALPDGSPDLVDDSGSVDVQLLDPEQWLTSCDDDALMAGVNLALVGSEIVQFGGAEALGDGAFRLSRLLRGRGGTEWAISGHGAGDAFVLIGAASLRQIAVPDWSSGLPITVRQSLGQGDASTTLTITGDSLRPWSPVDLGAALTLTGDLEIRWTRRSRVRCGWLDDVDMPLGERAEQYGVAITMGTQVVEYSCDAPSLIVAAADVASLGTGTATIAVRQIGDWGASRPAETQIILG